eukprot:COSAG02_NODE_2900_length_7779_cov_3.635547_7_plen_68_part_00
MAHTIMFADCLALYSYVFTQNQTSSALEQFINEYNSRARIGFSFASVSIHVLLLAVLFCQVSFDLFL